MDIGVATRPKPGEWANGDGAWVHQEGPVALVAVVDGLGHGPKAQEAAAAALAILEQHPQEELGQLMELCHQGLRGTRGAALTLVRVDSQRGALVHTAVGNAQVLGLGESRVRPVAVPGIVGANVRKVLVTTHEVRPGEVIVLFTDGISSRGGFAVSPEATAQAMAQTILETRSRPDDDATCVVIRM